MGVRYSKEFISKLLSQILADAAVFDIVRHFKLIRTCKKFYLTI